MSSSDASSPDALLRGLFRAALAAADPAEVLPPHLPARPEGRVLVVGAGKASAAMAAALERTAAARGWPGPLEGLVITRYGHGVPCERIRIVEAAHPVPDEAGRAATEAMLALLDDAGPEDHVLCLISGGGSALLCAPAPGISFEEKRRINAALLSSGAPIDEMNAVRKHLSAVKGGRLARRAAPSATTTYLISDVPGDDPAVIASGPTVGDPTTRRQALEILERYGVAVSEAVRAYLRTPEAETPKPEDPLFARNAVRLIATPQMALEAAAAEARARGIAAHILSDRIEGEARELAKALGPIARQIAERGQPFAAPCVLLSGGETTVTLRGAGRGGRNVEFLLALALALDGAPGVRAIACDTDGVDGREEIAGAVIGPETLAAARSAGLDPAAMLADNDAHSFFEAIGAQVVTGPTLTNVNDFRAVLVGTL